MVVFVAVYRVLPLVRIRSIGCIIAHGGSSFFSDRHFLVIGTFGDRHFLVIGILVIGSLLEFRMLKWSAWLNARRFK